MSGAPVRVVIAGVAGRMGQRILAAVRGDDSCLVVGATERKESPHVGLDAGLVTGAGPLEVQISGSLEAALDAAKPPAQVVIDFTTPAASIAHAKVCSEKGVALVVGTTGLSAQARADLAGAAQKIPLLMAPNMSAGVNMMFKLVAQAARALGKEYEIEIVEAHHHGKADAPSGTALRLAEVAADALGLDAEQAVVYARHGQIGPRKSGTIGVQTIRGGDVVGEHTVYFFGEGERLEVTHRASSRDNFARGAVRAARWLAGKPAGLYDMQDVLGLRGS